MGPIRERHYTVYRARRNLFEFGRQQGYGCVHRQRDWRLTDAGDHH